MQVLNPQDLYTLRTYVALFIPQCKSYSNATIMAIYIAS